MYADMENEGFELSGVLDMMRGVTAQERSELPCCCSTCPRLRRWVNNDEVIVDWGHVVCR